MGSSNAASERRQRILDLVRQEQYVTISQLSTELDVSESTIRNDLRDLDAEGLVERVHGGARAVTTDVLETDYGIRTNLRPLEKRQIAEVAAQFVEDRSVIGLDGSTTAFQLARCIAGRNLTVVTNGIYTALHLAKHRPTRVFLIGGELNLEGGCIVGRVLGTALDPRRSVPLGSFAGSEFACMKMHRFFTSPGGVTIAGGLMDSDLDENTVKEMMIAAADEVIALADYSKIGRSSLLSYAPLSAITRLITDSKADPEYIERLEKAGVTVLRAP